MKNSEKKAYAAPKIEVLVVELEQGIAGASTNTPGVESYGQGTDPGASWSGDSGENTF